MGKCASCSGELPPNRKRFCCPKCHADWWGKNYRRPTKEFNPSPARRCKACDSVLPQNRRKYCATKCWHDYLAAQAAERTAAKKSAGIGAERGDSPHYLPSPEDIARETAKIRAEHLRDMLAYSGSTGETRTVRVYPSVVTIPL